MKKLSDITNKSGLKKIKQTENLEKKIQKKPEFDLYRKYKWWIITGIFVFSFLLYANTLTHDYVLDDMIVTTDNPLVNKGVKGIPELISHGYFYANTGRNDESYRPLSMVVIAIETEIWGLNPKVNHFFSVFFYALACVILFLLLKRLFVKYHIFIPLAITLVYAAHPIHTEVVANIKSRDEIFHFLFISLTLLLILKFIDYKKIYFLILSLLCYFLAFMSKENAVTFVAVIPLMLWFFTDLKIKTIIYNSIPFFLILVFYMILRNEILDTITFKAEIDPFANALMAAKNTSEFYGTNLSIHLRYIELLFFPHPLSWDYSYNQIPIINLLNFRAIISLLLFGFLSVYAIIGLKSKNPVAFGILYYFITISIVSNFVVKIASTMGERFVFTASLGFCIALILFIVKIINKYNKAKFSPNILLFVVVLLLLPAIFKTIHRNRAWKSNEVMFQAGINDSPNSARTHMSLGSYYRRQLSEEKEPERIQQLINLAILEFNKSIEILPENAEAYYDMGFLYHKIGDKQKALESFLSGLKHKPNHKDLLNYAGIVYFDLKQFDLSKSYFLKVLELDTAHKHATSNLAHVYATLNVPDSSIFYYNRAIKQDLLNSKFYFEIANQYFKKGFYEDAKINYLKALEIDPSDKNVLKNISITYEKLKDKEKADFYRKMISE